MKTLKNVLFRNNLGLEIFYDNLVELKKLLAEYSHQKLKMIENSKAEIEQLLEIGEKMDREKLEIAAKNLFEQNEKTKKEAKEKIEKVVPREYL